MRTTRKLVGIGILCVLVAAGVAQAVPVYNLELAINTSEGTWELRAWEEPGTDTNYGIAGFWTRLSPLGDNTSIVLTDVDLMGPSSVWSPTGNPAISYVPWAGLCNNLSVQENKYASIAAFQDIASANPAGMPTNDDLIRGIGQTGGNVKTGTGPHPWSGGFNMFYTPGSEGAYDEHVLLAQGTYNTEKDEPAISDEDTGMNIWVDDSTTGVTLAQVNPSTRYITEDGERRPDLDAEAGNRLRKGHGEGGSFNKQQDWSAGPWGDPGQTIHLDASGTPGEIVDYAWTLDPNGNAGDPVTHTGPTWDLTLQELYDAGWDVPVEPEGYDAWLTLKIIEDTEDWGEAGTTLSIPEPTTIALLGLGCFGAVLRRRRR